MATMQEEMARVDYAECNDWEKNFYDSQKDGTYTPSPKQMGIINKMPKLANGSTLPQADTSFNHGANKPEPTRVSDDSVDDMIYKLGVIVEKDMIINQKTKVTIDELKSYNNNWLTNFMGS